MLKIIKESLVTQLNQFDRCLYKFLVYGIVDPRTGVIQYVGKSSTGLERLEIYRKYQGKYVHGLVGRKVRKLYKLGLEPLVFVIDVCQSEEEVLTLERFWIAELRSRGISLWNLTDGGIGPSGYKWTKNNRRKISDAFTLERREKLKHFNKVFWTKERRKEHGVMLLREVWTEDCRTRQSEIIKETWKTRSRIRSREANKKTSVTMKGKKKSPETIAKMIKSWTVERREKQSQMMKDARKARGRNWLLGRVQE